MLLLIKRHLDTVIQQLKTHPQETLEFKINQQLQTFSLSPPTKSVEEGKWLIAVTSFETTNSVFSIIDENNSFSITIPGQWQTKSDERTIDELNKLLELRSQKGIEIHVEEDRNHGLNLINDYSLSSLGTFKKEILEELKNVEHNDLQDLV